MTIINGILLSGWFQITILSILFLVYSNYVLSRKYGRGYLLGLMIGVFFVFTYASLNPLQALQFGGFDYQLNMLQVLGASIFGFFISVAMSMMHYTFRDNLKWRLIQVALITSMLIIALFLQVISNPEIRLMVSLFILAFGMATLFAVIMTRRRRPSAIPVNAAYIAYDEQATQAPRTRLDAVRNRIVQRINRNDVPTNPTNRMR
ncbi:MAG: hypothetical protein WBC91_05830 [Phototrophicaceae bacterium]